MYSLIDIWSMLGINYRKHLIERGLNPSDPMWNYKFHLSPNQLKQLLQSFGL